jgi:hypothetical protein
MAVAWNLVREAARQRAALFFLVLFAASGFLLPRLLTSDGTARGELHLSVVYGLGVPCFLTVAAAIALAAGGLAREVETRTAHLLVSKPLSSGKLVAGKLLGVVLVSSGLLGIALVLFAANVHLLRAGSVGRAGAEDLSVARVGVAPVVSVDEAALEGRIERRFREEEGRVPRASIEAALRRAAVMLDVAPGASVEIVFRGLDGVSPGNSLILLYRLVASPPSGSPQVPSIWRAGGAAARREETAPGVPHALAIPGAAVTAGGELRVEIENPSPPDLGTHLLVDPRDLEVLTDYGGFWPNVLRAALVILGQVIAAASIALAASAVFTLPTAHLVGFFVYLTGLASGFLRRMLASKDSLSGAGHRHGPALEHGSEPSFVEQAGEAFAAAGRFVLDFVLDLLPDFAGRDPLGTLAASRAVTIAECLDGLTWMVVVQGGAALAVAVLLFRRREIALGGIE